MPNPETAPKDEALREGPRVWIIENDYYSAERMKEIVANVGLTCLAEPITTAEKAIQLIRTGVLHDGDIVLLDNMLDDRDVRLRGEAVLTVIHDQEKERGIKITVIATTSTVYALEGADHRIKKAKIGRPVNNELETLLAKLKQKGLEAKS